MTLDFRLGNAVFGTNVLGIHGTTNSAQDLSLNANYVAGVSGPALGVHVFGPPGNVHVDEIYWWLTTAPASSGVLVSGITAYGATTSRPATSFLNSGNCYAEANSGTTSSKWVKFTLTDTTALTPGEFYFALIHLKSGETNYPTIRRVSASVMYSAYNTVGGYQGYYTADGFATNGSSSAPVPFVIKFSDGTYYSHPYALAPTADASSSLERGLKITGLDSDICVYALRVNQNTSISGFKVYEGESTPPGGTIYSGFNGGSAWSTPTNVKNVSTITGFTPFILKKETVYRIVLTYSSATTAPGYQLIDDDSSFSDVPAIAYLQNKVCRTIDNGSGGWTDNNTAGDYKLPRLNIIYNLSPVTYSFTGMGITIS